VHDQSSVKDGDRISGAFGYWRETGMCVVFHAKAVILATGGIGKVYGVTSIPGNTPVMGRPWPMWPGRN